MEVHSFLTNSIPQLPYAKAAEVAETYELRNLEKIGKWLGRTDVLVAHVEKEYEALKADLDEVAMLE